MGINRDLTNRRIRELRKEKGITQSELAQKLHVKRQIISYYETSRMPNTEDLLLLADELNTTTDYLLGRTAVKTTDPKTKDVCEYTGLSEAAVSVLHNATHHDETAAHALNHLLTSAELPNILWHLCSIAPHFPPYDEIICGGKSFNASERMQAWHLLREIKMDMFETKELFSAFVDSYVKACGIDFEDVEERIMAPYWEEV